MSSSTSSKRAGECKHTCRDKSTCGHLICCRRSGENANQAKDNASTQASKEPVPAAMPDPIRHGASDERAPVFMHEYRGSSDFQGTQELFEMTLKFLSPGDLLRLKAVDRHWRDTISGNTMRKALFLAPDVTEVAIPARLSKRWPHIFGPGGNAPGKTKTRYFNDALFFQRENPWGPSSDLDYNTCTLEFKGNPLALGEDDARLNMFITQPPCQEFMFWVSTYRFFKPTRERSARTEETRKRYDISQNDGIIFRHLVDQIKLHLGRKTSQSHTLDFINSEIFINEIVIANGKDTPEMEAAYNARDEVLEDMAFFPQSSLRFV